MSGNTELLNFVYQNSQMGMESLSQLLEIAEDTMKSPLGCLIS